MGPGHASGITPAQPTTLTLTSITLPSISITPRQVTTRGSHPIPHHCLTITQAQGAEATTSKQEQVATSSQALAIP